MSPAEARREACRILRDMSGSMKRSLAEVERLLVIAEGSNEEVEMRRHVEHDREINPEFYVGGV